MTSMYRLVISGGVLLSVLVDFSYSGKASTSCTEFTSSTVQAHKWIFVIKISNWGQETLLLINVGHCNLGQIMWEISLASIKYMYMFAILTRVSWKISYRVAQCVDISGFQMTFKPRSYPSGIDEGPTAVIMSGMNFFVILRVVSSILPETRYDGWYPNHICTVIFPSGILIY